MRQEFYQKALPSQGVFCVAGIDTEGRTYQRFTESFSDLERFINEFDNGGFNVFVALHSFSGNNRKGDAALYCKTFFVDLDVDPENDKKYASKQEALDDIDKFLTSSGLPPPVRVDSGNGIHAYWILDQDVPSQEWRVYANKFKKFCLQHLKIDPTVTSDSARILRCPDTWNRKRTPVVRTQLLDDTFYEWSYDEFKEYLGKSTEPESIFDILPKGVDEDTKKIGKYDNYETTFQDIAEKSLADNGCNQIKHALLNSRTLSYDEWYSALGIARHCNDWETAIHLLSEDYEGYDREKTEWKANQTVGTPRSCEFFAANWPDRCEGCAFKGRIRNPLGIGRRVVPAPTAEEVGQADAVRIEEDPQTVPNFPQYLLPFFRGKTGGIYYQPPKSKNDEGDLVESQPILLYTNDFFPVKRKYSQNGGEIYVVRLVMPHEAREFDVPMEAFNSIDVFKKSLGREGIAPPSQKLWPLLVDYMTKWAHYLQAQSAADIIRGQMGWTPDNTAFVLGAVEIDKSGDELKSATSPLVRGVARMFEPRGNYDKWKECANELNRPDFEMHAFAVGMAFGSPLMRFSATKGMTFCYTGNTGAAKTGALLAAVSVFAYPPDASVYKATDNGFVARALNFKNIMLGIDEVKDKDPRELSNLIHSISQGKGKIRMQASVNAEREQELTAAQISLWTSNESMTDKLFASKRNPTGELARYMEYRIVRPKYLQDNPEKGEAIFDPFNTNCGWAGREYIKHLMQMPEHEIESAIQRWRDRIAASRFGKDISYRFFENATAAAFAGLELANRFGIIAYDLDRIFDKVMLQSIMVRDKTVKEQVVDYAALLTEFFYKNHRGILIFNNGVSTTDIYGPLLGRIELDTGMQYIQTRALNDFLALECKVSTDEMVHNLKQAGILVGIEEKKRLSTGWKGGTMNGVRCYVFKMNPSQELLDKLIKDGKTDRA